MTAAEGDWPRVLALRFAHSHEDEALAILERRPPEEVAAFLEEIPAEIAARLVKRMAPMLAADCLGHLSAQRLLEMSESLPLETGAALLRRMDDGSREAILGAFGERTAGSLRLLLRYPEGSVGALMDPRVPALPGETTVEEALARAKGELFHGAHYLYVVDREQRLTGVLSLRELLTGEASEELRSIMHAPVARLPALADRRSILDHPGLRLHHALPVVESGDRYIGAIRYEIWQDLQRSDRAAGPGGAALTTAMRLGELLWVALAGILMTGFEEAWVAHGAKPGTGEGRDHGE